MTKDHFSSEFMELDRRCGKRHGGNMKTLKTSPAVLFANFEESMKQIAERVTIEIKRSFDDLAEHMDQLWQERRGLMRRVVGSMREPESIAVVRDQNSCASNPASFRSPHLDDTSEEGSAGPCPRTSDQVPRISSPNYHFSA